MNVILWVVQILLAIVFVVSGVAKLTRSGERLSAGLPGFHPGVIRLVSVAEIVGALGLILPGITGIAPILTPPGRYRARDHHGRRGDHTCPPA